MNKEMYKVGDKILLPDNTILIAVHADTDGAGELVCEDKYGHKCYFLGSNKKCPSSRVCTNGYTGVIFIQNNK